MSKFIKDEAYLDCDENTSNAGDWDKALSLCRQLQEEVSEKVGLTASFGIGTTRVIAKMSSEINKPNGIFRVLPDEINSFSMKGASEKFQG